jgi:hypothetical protein
MTVVVDLNIPVPADTDNYNLVLDLTSMKNGILEALNDVIVELGQRPETGSAAAFLSVTCTSTGIFGGSVSVNSLNGGSPGVLSNSISAFGLTKGADSFLHNGSKWISSDPIQIVDGVHAQDAVTRAYIDVQMAQVQAWDTALQANIQALDDRTVARSGGRQTWAPNADWATSANYANTAGSAGSTASATYATSAGSATTAANSDKLAGRTLQLGSGPAHSLAGQANWEYTVNFSDVGYVPAFFFTVLGETGVQSILGSVKWVTQTQAKIIFFNKNASTAETFWFNWMTI